MLHINGKIQFLKEKINKQNFPMSALYIFNKIRK